MSDWTDSHNHLQDPRLGATAAMIRECRESGIRGCLTNATREADWSAVENLANQNPEFIRAAFGIHPWHAGTATPGWLDRLTRILENDPLASVGECGLDGWVSQPTIDAQRPVFAAQLSLAVKLDRPVTIHCLRAWEPLFETFDQSPPPPRFLMHSFGGSLEVAHRLISLGAYFSFSGYFLNERKTKVLEVFKQLPRERILLESDAPDMSPPALYRTHPLPADLNHPANLPAIGKALAAALSMTPETLATLTRSNHERCFGV